jgi:acetone carboxylase gamma subunit
MKTQLIICNEADYLQAHLTFIVSKPRPGNPVFHDFKQRVTSLLKKWIRAAEGGLAKRNEHRLIARGEGT